MAYAFYAIVNLLVVCQSGDTVNLFNFACDYFCDLRYIRENKIQYCNTNYTQETHIWIIVLTAISEAQKSKSGENKYGYSIKLALLTATSHA